MKPFRTGHHRFSPTLLALWGGVLLTVLAAGCSSGTLIDPEAQYTVTYSLEFSGPTIIDSIRYDNGNGTMLKVGRLEGDWALVLELQGGQSVRATAWGEMDARGSAELAVTWESPGMSPGSASEAVSKDANDPQGAIVLDIQRITLGSLK
jgi:hypothetical protein